MNNSLQAGKIYKIIIKSSVVLSFIKV